MFNLDSYKLAAYELARKIPFYTAEGIFQYGSSVYKNKKPADIDVIVVYSSETFTEDVQIVSGEYNLNAYHLLTFIEKLSNDEIDALECLCLKDAGFSYISPILQPLLNSHTINATKLRRSIASVSSNAFVKAKKKLVVPADRNLTASIKSLWHSFRVMDYGIQLAKYGTINYSSCNSLYIEIINDYKNFNLNWDLIYQKYKPLMNEKHSEFKSLCPLDKD